MISVDSIEVDCEVDRIIQAYERGIAKGSEVSQDVKNSEYQRGRLDGVNYANNENRLKMANMPVTVRCEVPASKKIDAIKAIRATSNVMSLQQAKEYVDLVFEVCGIKAVQS